MNDESTPTASSSPSPLQSVPGTEKPLLATMGGATSGLSESHLNIALEKTGAIDGWLSAGSEWFSAILVKETRQALKSRQFVWTFFLLLVVVATWGIFSISLSYSDSWNPAELGPTMLAGFFFILGFPLAIIIPFSTYRSLAHEYENETLQMVSITTLKPYQIVAGKLGSSMLQIMMYVSILAPCMAFTYLLRGVDIYQVLFGLLVGVFGSVCLCCICLFLAGGVQRKAFGVGITVLLIPVLGLVYMFYCMLAVTVSFDPSFNLYSMLPQAMIAQYAFFVFGGTTAGVAFVAATSQIAFDTENRTTRIRVALMVQQVFFIGIFVAFLGVDDFVRTEAFYSVTYLYGHYWLGVGAMLVSTSPIISRRVLRSHPKTVMGRLVFGLLMPGAGRAYLFAVGNLISCAITVLVLLLFHDYLIMKSDVTSTLTRFAPVLEIDQAILGLVVNLVYPLLFLSATFLLVNLLKSYNAKVPPLFGLFVAAFLVLAGYLIGMGIQYNFYRGFATDYTAWQAFYWYGTASNIFLGGAVADGMAGLAIAGIATVVLGFVAFRIARRDLAYVDVATPARVLEEREAIRMAKRGATEEAGESFEDMFNEPREGGQASNE